MAKKLISQQAGHSAIESGDQAMAVRYLLQLIEQSAPGGAVELRVPPFGAVQCLSGSNHRRGTPPTVVEMKPQVFLDICLNALSWDAAVGSGIILASGKDVDRLSKLFPLDQL